MVFGGSEGTIDLEEAEGLILGSSESGWADNLGYALAATGDIDGDGRTELLVGAPGHEEEGVQAGAAYLFSGASLAR